MVARATAARLTFPSLVPDALRLPGFDEARDQAIVGSPSDAADLQIGERATAVES